MRKTRRLTAMLLVLTLLFSVLVTTIVSAESDGYATVTINKHVEGKRLNVYEEIVQRTADPSKIVYPVFEDASTITLNLAPGNYTWNYGTTVDLEGNSIYNYWKYFSIKADDVGTEIVMDADPGYAVNTGNDASGLKLESDFPNYPGIMTDIINDVSIFETLDEVTEEYFSDPYKYDDIPQVDPVFLDMLGIEDLNEWGKDPWGRWENHGWFTPSFNAAEKAKHEFTTQDEMVEFLEILDEYDNQINGNDGKGVMHMYSPGVSEQGTPMYYLIFSKEGVTTPEEAVALDRTNVFLQAQIHGNEHSPGEAALYNSYRLVSGELDVLDNLVISMIPMLNPDGAYLHQRIPANSYNKDLNRDNLTFDNQESRVNHGEFIKFNAHMYLDDHEFSGNGQYNITLEGDEEPTRHMFMYDYELSSGKNFNIPQSIRDLTNKVIVPEVTAKLEEIGGFRMIEYTEQQRIEGAGIVDPSFIDNLVEYEKDALGNDIVDENGEKKLVPSTDPNRTNLDLTGVTGDYFRELMPNSRHSYDAHGLQGAVNFLVEIRGFIGKNHWVRRVKTQADVNAQMIQWANDNAELLKETVESTWEHLENNGGIYGDGDEIVFDVLQDFTDVRDFTAINLDDNTVTTLPVSFWNTQNATVLTSREMPTGYILPKGESYTIEFNDYESTTDDIVQRLMKYNGTEVFELAAGTTLDLEQYVVEAIALAEAPTSYEGYPRYFVDVEVEPASVTFENGAYLIPNDQRSAILTAMSMEPDLDGSFVMFNKFGTDYMPGDVLPIYRCITDNPRDLAESQVEIVE